MLCRLLSAFETPAQWIFWWNFERCCGWMAVFSVFKTSFAWSSRQNVVQFFFLILFKLASSAKHCRDKSRVSILHTCTTNLDQPCYNLDVALWLHMGYICIYIFFCRFIYALYIWKCETLDHIVKSYCEVLLLRSFSLEAVCKWLTQYITVFRINVMTNFLNWCVIKQRKMCYHMCTNWK